MSNRALLFGTDDGAAPTEEPSDAWLAASYSLPLFWLALFDNEAMVEWPCTLDPSSRYTALVTPRLEALERASGRLASWVARWQELEPIAASFTGLLTSPRAQFVGVWTEELSDMSGDEEWRATLQDYLGALDQFEAVAMKDMLAQSYLRVEPTTGALHPVAAPLAVAVAGSGWRTPAPWEPTDGAD